MDITTCRYVYIFQCFVCVWGGLVLRYTTIRISVRDKERLKRLAKLLGYDSIADTLRYALDLVEKEVDKTSGDLNKVLSSLKYAKDIGETTAEEIDKYLYGEQ